MIVHKVDPRQWFEPGSSINPGLDGNCDNISDNCEKRLVDLNCELVQLQIQNVCYSFCQQHFV